MEEDTNIEHSTNSIYPNPSNGYFKIDIGFSLFDEACFLLYNIAECQVMPKTYIAANRQSFTYPNLPIGLYYVNVIIDEKVIRKKLMVVN